MADDGHLRYTHYTLYRALRDVISAAKQGSEAGLCPV